MIAVTGGLNGEMAATGAFAAMMAAVESLSGGTAATGAFVAMTVAAIHTDSFWTSAIITIVTIRRAVMSSGSYRVAI
jgi:hypothetical protein